MTEETPHAAGTALLLIDLVNDLDVGEGEALQTAVEAIVDPVLGLMEEARQAGVPIIYVNDNFGHWHSDRERIVEHCLREESRGRGIVERLRPARDDYFVIKPQFSGFYATNLPVLLPQLGVSRLILTGVAADICVLFTAADAHMREYDLWIPADAVASERDGHRDWALGIMAHSMHAETRATNDFTLREWLDRA